VEPRRTRPFAVEETLGGTADLALIAGLVSEGGDREGDEDEMRFGSRGVLVAVVAMMSEARGYARGYIGVVQANQTNGLEVTRPANEWGRGGMMCWTTWGAVPT